MSGNEIINNLELNALKEIFTKSNGVLFAHGFDKRRNNIFRVQTFEKNLAKYLKCKYAVACSSGTAAGYLALKSIGIGPGDEVIVQAFTFIAALESIIQTGAKPVIIDCDDSLGMCPKDLKDKISKKTKCIMPVHMLGESVNCEEIIKISKKFKIPIIEDACESLGAKYKKKYLGTLGKVGFFSLDFGKVITTGEGGFLCTNDKKIYIKLKAMRDHGHENKKNFHRGLDKAIEIGFNYRMTEMQAAIGIVQLKKINQILNKKKKNKKLLIKNLNEIILNNKIKVRHSHNPNSEQFDHFVMYFQTEKKAKKVYNYLNKKKIHTGILPVATRWHYAGYWNHLWQKCKKNNQNQFHQKYWKNTSNLISRSVSLHISINETAVQIKEKAKKIIAAVNKF